jgi:hypothetical protein
VDLIDTKGMTLEGAKLALNSRGTEKNPHQTVINQLLDIRKGLQALNDELA